MNIRKIMVFLITLATVISGIFATADVGDKAPDFILENLNGGSVNLSSYIGKQPVLLVFWATWCPPCRKEIPDLKIIFNKYNPLGLALVSIAVPSRQTKETVKSFMKKSELPYVTLWDDNEKASQAYEVNYIPTNLIIDRKGIIRYRGSSIMNSDALSAIENSLPPAKK